MTVLSLQQIIEEHDARKGVCRVIIGGQILPKWTSVSYNFAISEVPTATIVVPNRSSLPSSVVEEASVQIWVGFRVGIATVEELVFGGAVVDSVGNDGPEVIIECVMDGPRKLQYSYNRTIDFAFDNVTAEEAVEELLTLAGVKNYAINLDPWLIGTAVPQTIEFSTYGEAINKVAEVDGSPWYALPSGMVRVEDRSPVPADTARRTYFSGVLTGSVESQPVSITNSSARPRINNLQRRKFRSEVGNFITVNGAVVTTIGPLGEQNSEQIIETVDGNSGQFPTGAYWIPIPPLYQHFIFSNELIDTNAKAFEVAERYFNLKNRLFEEIPLSIPGDPDVFLGSTVKIVDPMYSGVSSLYFVKAYRTTIDANSFQTELTLTGGPESGTIGFAAPFAEFFWKYTALHDLIQGPAIPGFDLGTNADQAAKLCQDVPAGTGDSSYGGGFLPGEDKRTVLIGLDASASKDFDGTIVSYDWEWTDDQMVVHQFSGIRQTLIIDPNVMSSVQVTLTVTDDTGRTDSITKTIYTTADYVDVPGIEPTLNDTSVGGGVAAGPCTEPAPAPGEVVVNPPGEDGPPPPGTPCPEGDCKPGDCNGLSIYYFLAADDYVMGTEDNRTWNDLLVSAAGGGANKAISVAAAVNPQNQQVVALFGTDGGAIIRSIDVCLTGEVVFTAEGNPRINCLHFDTTSPGNYGEGDEDSISDIPVYTQGTPGILTIEEAYRQCLAVGFDPTTAITAVAIMIAESGLDSDITNENVGPPASTDRGIAQINDYYHPEVSDACAFNTACAIAEMYRISSGGTDFTPWSAFNARTYIQHLSTVQAAIGIEDAADIGDFTPFLATGMRAWAGTDDGRIYVSYDSGKTWELWHDFRDGFPIMNIATPRPWAGSDTPSLWVFGGDTSNPNSLVRIDPAKTKEFFSLPIGGTLRQAINAAGGGFSCISTTNQTASLLAFNGGVIPPVWASSNPLEDPESWMPAIGLGASSIETAAPGYGGEFLVA